MSVPVLSVAQMREWETATWAKGIQESEVIHRVGEILARFLRELTSPSDAIVILAGKGHNGDDARAAQTHLPDRQIILINVEDPSRALVQFEGALDKCKQAKTDTWVVDALFGIGLNRPLNKDWVALIEAVNRSLLPIVAVDTPSGLNAETGIPEGAAIRAAVTITVGAPKRGMLSYTARPYVGKLEIAPEIGLVPCPLTSDLYWTQAEDFEGFPPRRATESHKGTYGHVAIFAGSVGYHGASVLATHAAQRAQPGLVSLWTQPSVYVPVASQMQAAMVHPWGAGTALPKSITGVLIGPGLAATDLSEDFKEAMRSLWQDAPMPVVVDASALDWLNPGPTRGGTRVITPHPGEAARMLNCTTEEVQHDRFSKLRELSKRFGGCHVVLKGNQTLAGRAEGQVFVNGTGDPFLAQGGTGDVLGGFIAGLLAQPRLQQDPMTAIRYAIWEHGTAAERLSQNQPNWTTDDLVQHLAGE